MVLLPFFEGRGRRYIQVIFSTSPYLTLLKYLVSELKNNPRNCPRVVKNLPHNDKDVKLDLSILGG
ncbi:MAG: hypothetical protein COV74_05215 [Candidatus Omnitrophica bacterium CG11_big_fil_rev_8_21_14_0_20_45_26]|uniref:Uncharacterized protein n=1 Tax=Candidatus Abzuiibacterium crystallinum TaxID=1974748 RepID=A0A2H0LRR4_9BACT|nr:MAG: hypothetical protein COV74_05215 [Candidatus Omnitrophica bacterium CG11_big_fil_rev_8_21_14_0_20_45_26]PIW63552.1 MAG: hypothetical protein COW12_10125 [Candidatus Omnitrophica bacterium CG12_big_fil_rev_8_21_14_0_65_45_16]